jgi:putative flippase GtrA
VVGVVCVAADIGLFNLLHFGAGIGPLTAKTIGVVIATTMSYVGHRHWSFRHRQRTGVVREYPVFFLLNAVGLGVALVALAIGRYGLGLTSPLMLNVANGAGLVLGTAFRFWGYRRWVFRDLAAADLPGAPLQRSA